MAQILNELAELRQQVEDSSSAMKAFKCGHPILMLAETDDVASFDVESGIGSGCWERWAICTGGSYVNTKGKRITTPDLRNNFVVGAGDDYEVGDVGGANTVALTTAEMPTHSHGVTDAGHTHGTTQTAHNHGVTQSPHNHAASQVAHDHGIDLNTSSTGDHEHETGFAIISDAGTGLTVRTTGTSGSSTSTNGAHVHGVTGDTDQSTPAITVDNASITISVNNASISLTVDSEETGLTVNEAGDGDAHENRPPYYAVLFVMYIG
jgi:microcystin-dependent protein